MITASTIALLAASPAFAGNVLPSGGSVAAGGATISQPNSTTLNINQSTNQAIINWNSFSVGRGDTVNFNQPGASSATLNRVTGATPSWIAGAINAPGTVLLVNPNGIAITKSGVVNTGAFAASTLGIKDSDFLSGHYSFSGNSASAGVINSGRINVSDGGFAALLGGQVANNGVIAARLGKVALGAGEQATLDLSGDGFLSVAVPSSELGHLTTANGALVENKGKILADGGTVFLSAATASNILRDAVNMGGYVGANSVGLHDGRIVINGGGGNVNVTGKLMARSRKGKGGEVDITSAGAGVRLVGALIDVSGKTGGGVVNIGGGPHATTALADAQSVSIDSVTVIKADAADRGDGGHIVIWSNGKTAAHGKFSAKGGANGGNGGLIETSGHSVDFGGITVNASAAKGAAGTWLVDPTDLTIDGAAANTILAALENGTSVTLQTNIDGSTSGPGNQSSGAGDIDIDANIADFNINQTATLTLLAANNINVNQLIAGDGGIKVVMQAANTVNIKADVTASALTIVAQGDINVTSAVGDFGAGATKLTAGGNINLATALGHNELGSDAALTAGGSISIVGGSSVGGLALSAYDNITISGNFTNTSGGTVNLSADSMGGGSGTVSFTNGAQLSAGGAAVNIFYYPGSTNYASPTSYSGNVTGAGSLTAYMLVNNVSDLEAINNNLGGTYALAADINANNAAFYPIGFTPNAAFSGLFDGRNHLVSNLTSSLFFENTGVIRNVGVGGAISAAASQQLGDVVGGLVDTNFGTISNSFSTMMVNATSGGFAVGGLVGENSGGTITNSYATGNVTSRDTGQNFDDGTGGLVGINAGTIQYSYATGNVSGSIDAGGLVGWNNTQYTDHGGTSHFVFSTINYAYALGSVAGYNVGGLVGKNDFSATGASVNGEVFGVIENSYAAGHVSCSGPNCTFGGIVGLLGYTGSGTATGNFDDLSAKVFWSIWNADTTGTTKPFGFTYQDAYKCAGNPSCSTNEVQFIGFVSSNSGLTSASAANLGSPYLASSYTTPQNGIFNDPTPGNTTSLQGSFSSNWYMVDGSTMPILRAEYSTTIQNAHQLELMNLNTSATYTLARDITYTNDGLWTSAGFSPIATFNGTLNGNGNTISGLVASASNLQNAGLLFNVLGPGSAVENLGIVNGQLSVDNSQFNFTGPNTSSVGALVGWNDQGSIVNVWATGTTVSTYDARYVGGLVGANAGFIDQSYTNATVSGVYQRSWDNWTFVDNEGGLVGYNNGTISNAYAIGSVSGNGNVGGLVGFNDGGTISNTYTTAQVFRAYSGYGIQAAGPLVGDNNGHVYNSYWDSTVATVGGNGAGAGLTTAQMQNINSFQTTYSGWDFQRVWVPPSSGYYPELYANSYVAVIWPGATSMTYGSSVPTLTASVFGLRSYDPTSTISISSISTGATSSSNVGTYAINATSGSYPYISINGTVPPQVAVATGTVPSSVNQMGYGFGEGNCGGYTCSITVNGVKVDPYSYPGAFDMTAGGSAAMFNYYLAAVGIHTTVSNGRLVLTSAGPITIGGPDPSSYGLAAGTTAAVANAPVSHDRTAYRILTVPGTLTINPLALTGTVDFSDINKVYDGNASASGGSLTLTSSSGVGLAGNAQVTIGVASGTYADGANVAGVETVDVTGLSIAGGNSNYNIAGLIVNGSGSITPAPVTVSANGGTSTYGSSPINPGLSASGLQNGQTVSVLTGLSNSFGITHSSDAGNYTLNVLGSLTNPNYTVTVTNSGTWTVNPASITVTALGGTSTYGSSPINPGFSASGLQNGQDVSVLTGLSNSFGITNLSNAGGYMLSVNGTVANSNYTITTRNSGLWTVNPAQITVSANGGTSTYGSSPSNPGLSANGLQNGQDASVLTGLSNSFGITNLTNAGGYTLNVQGVLANSNYTVTGTNNGAWTVTPAPITVSANGGTSIYGSSPGNPGLSASGLQNGQDVSVLTGLSNSFGITNLSNAGSYTLNVNGVLTNSNYTVTGTNTGTWAVTPATLALRGSKSYDGTTTFLASAFGSNGTISTGINGETLALTGSGSVTSPNVVAGTQVLTLGTLQFANGTGLASNYVIAKAENTGRITPAPIMVTANGGSSTYGSSPANPGLSASGLQNGETVSVLTGLSNSFGITHLSNVGDYVLRVLGELTNFNYMVTRTHTGTWTVNPATLQYVATPSTQFAGITFTPFTGTVTGFVNGQTMASATTGTPSFTTSATPQSAPGSYGIFGSGLSADFGNYVFVQAPGNATALTLNPAPSNPPSQTTPPTGNTPSNPVAINFSNPNPATGAIHVSFTTTTRTASNSGNSTNTDVNPSALPPGEAFAHNHGLYFPPISQYDADQYSDFKLPPYAKADSQATVLTILARGIAQANAAHYMIDGFWNGADNTWPGPGHIDLLDKATFSDGAGHEATPTNDPAFPIASGKTDLAALVKNGPVMIGSPNGQSPSQWLLATAMMPDGKGIVCDDTQTGGLVELSWDPATKTAGGIVAVFDMKANRFVPVADAKNDIPADDANGLSGLQSFVPSTFFAVTPH